MPNIAAQGLAGSTMVVTRQGNHPIAELAGAKHLLLTGDRVWVEAPVRSLGRHRLYEVVVSRSGVIKKIAAAAGHRWLLHNVQRAPSETTTAELKSGNRIRYAFPQTLACALDRVAVARGFVFGDGSAMHGKSCANFYGAKDDALMPFFLSYKAPRQYGSLRRITCLPISWKTQYPDLDSEPGILRGWLAGYFAADGDVGKTGRPTLSSANRNHLEFVRRLGMVIGIGTFGIRSRMRLGYGKTETALYLVGLMRKDLSDDFFLIEAHRARFTAGKTAAERRSWNVVKIERLSSAEEVFGAHVEGAHTFALEDNILMGDGTSPSTRSWRTRPTSSTSCTRCGRWSA